MKLNFTAALLALAALTAISLLVLLVTQTGGQYTEEEAISDAKSFLISSPTFRFDGIESSIQPIRAEEAEPRVWSVTLTFESRHSGYGDRTGQVLLQVITPHTIEVKIDNGEIVSAVIDGIWDELSQNHL